MHSNSYSVHDQIPLTENNLKFRNSRRDTSVDPFDMGSGYPDIKITHGMGSLERRGTERAQLMSPS